MGSILQQGCHVAPGHMKRSIGGVIDFLKAHHSITTRTSGNNGAVRNGLLGLPLPVDGSTWNPAVSRFGAVPA
jgi:hypothetical protein